MQTEMRVPYLSLHLANGNLPRMIRELTTLTHLYRPCIDSIGAHSAPRRVGPTNSWTLDLCSRTDHGRSTRLHTLWLK